MDVRQVIAISLLVLLSPQALAQLVTIEPGSPGGWFPGSGNTGTGSLSTNNPHGTGGNGSLELILDGSDGQIVNATRIPILTLHDITKINWDAATNSSNVPVPKVEYWSPTAFGTLFPQPLHPGDGSWQTYDGMTLQWFTTQAGYPASRTFAEWQAELGDVRVNFFSVGIGSSSGAVAATTAYIDMVSLNATTWDFEGDAPLPPVPEADVAVVKTLDSAGPFVAGDVIQYTVAVSNAGPDASVDVLVDDVPTNLTILTVSSANCAALPCTLASLAGGVSEIITLSARIDAAGAFDNAAGAGSSLTFDPDTSNNIDNTGNGGIAQAQEMGPGPPDTSPPGEVTEVPLFSGWDLVILALLMVWVGFIRLGLFGLAKWP
ncbi:hypothetical protein GCM10007052_31090 [Halioglobus japonicus]|uniref:DUF11 domain-containing protein n=1 Tax=Halioglobus japonicus TaxID=930805 RepID=A0AAP8SLL1_9GAMM|nr:DUF11 domain-containing protein [Halioglobus japonicus]PLW84690.1 hypothetical protein C0029_16930 [Halioglobus japonicus]GHD20926.1 hypothetical protein GCM10007052_31090 [Halioglobus japonicus]